MCRPSYVSNSYSAWEIIQVVLRMDFIDSSDVLFYEQFVFVGCCFPHGVVASVLKLF